MRTIVLLGTLLAGLLISCGPDRDSYVADNESLLGEFAPFPGATERDRQSTPYSSGDSGLLDATDGYVTIAVFEAPGGTMADELFDHYRAIAGSSWRHSISEVPVTGASLPPSGSGSSLEGTPAATAQPLQVSGPLVLSLCRGDAHVGIVADNLQADGSFRISVDARAARSGRPSPC